MIRRVGRIGRPGLIGLAARTAVVAGTANAVTNHAQNRAEAQAEAQALQAQAAVAVPPARPANDDLTAQLTRLADLKNQGMLSDQEFDAAKMRLLGS